MPIGVEIARRVDRKKEQDPRWDDRGEEGVFHVVSMDGDRYWAKQWYKMHDKAKGIKPTENASPCSPYWHKLKYYEYQLMHEAFPEHTIKLVSGYDERIQRSEEGEYSFNIFGGQPTTVSVEIAGDPVLSAQRNEALKRAYAVLLNFLDQNYHRSTKDNPFFPQWRQVVDAEMQKILGSGIHVPFFTVKAASWDEGRRQIAREMSRIAREIKERQPDSVIAEMLESGIIPTHPELNFIPDKPGSKTKPPHGTFVELAIRDMDRFAATRRKAFADKPKELAKFNKKLERYNFYRLLDKIFDDLFLFSNYGPKDAWKYEAEVQTALFRLTEAIKQAYDGQNIEVDQDSLKQLQDAVREKFNRGFHPGHVAMLIQTEITDMIKEKR